MDYRNKGENGKIVKIANRSYFDKYLKEASNFKPLTKEEEVKLFKQYSVTRDQRILDKICRHNLLFVVTVARHYATALSGSSTLSLEDLINEGNVGLCVAATKFDYSSGNKFISYAVWWIRQNILKCLQDNIKTIRIPANNRKEIVMVTNKRLELEQKNNSDVSLDYVLNQMLLDGDIKTSDRVENLAQVMKMYKFEKSLNNQINDDDKTEIIDMLSDNSEMADQQVIKNERMEFLSNIIMGMKPENVRYIVDYYGLNNRQVLNFREISEKYNVPEYIVRDSIKREIKTARLKNKHIFAEY